MNVQEGPPERFQVPEGWAGNLAQARIVFLSSNPSISEPKEGKPPESAEAYPAAADDNDLIADFVVHRFDGCWARPEGKHRRIDGGYTYVAFWGAIRKVATDLLGYQASPAADYVMTEVVHCKSKGETGVNKALDRCSGLHMDRILADCPAAVMVVVGGKARDRVARIWDLGWDKKHTPAVVREIAGRRRTIVQLAHPAAFGANEYVSTKYPEHLAVLRAAALGAPA
ncbi:hypothetical protein [Promicromonospora sp. MEB111]|uniref:hypothetical protein n=1 Tax=Promicromonospora sp. MEB111 TaxID=3040301 RepID=UPI00254B2C04|nr:hypothetical protein [Promicromonospora sp. MEB111]